MVNASPEYVAGIFQYSDHSGEDNGRVPPKAVLRSTSADTGCRPSTVHSFQFEDTDSDDQGGTDADITVDFRGSDDNNHFGGYLGNELYDNGDNAPHSAWVYILQNTMLYNAQLDATAGNQWSNTMNSSKNAELDAGQNVQSFFGAVPQMYSHLGKMLGLVTGQETSQEEISGLSDGEIKEILDAAFESPVMIIPKESNKERLDGYRIWIASKKVANQDKWSFFNPVEKEKAVVELDLAEVKSLGEQIIFTTDHRALTSD